MQSGKNEQIQIHFAGFFLKFKMGFFEMQNIVVFCHEMHNFQVFYAFYGMNAPFCVNGSIHMTADSIQTFNQLLLFLFIHRYSKMIQS